MRNIWSSALSMSAQCKCTRGKSLHETLTTHVYRLGEALLLFGMGITLTEEEDRRLESARNSSYAAIGLTNDFLSFDREYDEFQASGQSQIFMNAVWLHMK